jgi:D-serine dehydratase
MVPDATGSRHRQKGMPLRVGDAVGWSIFDGDIPYPIAIMHEAALESNGRTMREYCLRNGVDLAPHGKTTMSPELFHRQIADGAWAITAATTWQAKVMWEAGVPRVLIANEVVSPGEIEWLASARADGFDVICYVDSVAGVAIFDEVLERLGLGGRFPVLIEMGVVGGRAGVRSVEDGLVVAAAVAASPHLALTGTAGFEGILGAQGDRSAQDVVDEFLDQIVALTGEIDARGWFEPSPDLVVTAGGSAFFDRVVARFAVLNVRSPVRVVIRSGCYLSHDDGSYRKVSPMGDVGRTGHPDHLIPAIEVWGAVLSRPEPTRAIVGAGKRDASSDGLLPIVKKVRRRGSSVVEVVRGFRAAALNDQHTYLDLDQNDPLAVGDLVGFGISHPCTTFDKWRVIPIVDDEYRVTSLAHTLF